MLPSIIESMIDNFIGILSIVITIAIAATTVIWSLQGRFTKLETNVTNLATTVIALTSQVTTLVSTLGEIKVQEHRLRTLEAQVVELRARYHDCNNKLQRVMAFLEIQERREGEDLTHLFKEGT